MITVADLHALAVFMVESHGPKALTLADLAVGEMMAQNESESTECWLALRSVVEDMLSGRIADGPISIH